MIAAAGWALCVGVGAVAAAKPARSFWDEIQNKYKGIGRGIIRFGLGLGVAAGAVTAGYVATNPTHGGGGGGFSYQPPNTPTASVTVLSDTAAVVTGTAFVGSGDDTHDSTDTVFSSFTDADSLLAITFGNLTPDSTYKGFVRHNATEGGASGVDSVEFTMSQPSSNEPAGFTTQLDEDFTSGLGALNNAARSGSYSVTGGKLVVTYPNGMTAGYPAWLFYGSGNAGGPAAYISFNVTMDANWYGHSSTVNKIVFHTRRSDDEPQGYLMFKGSGTSNPLRPAINTQGWPMPLCVLNYNGATGSGDCAQYTNQASPSAGDAQVVRGAETFVEMLTHYGTANQSDGYIKVWVDGVLILHYTGLALTSSGQTPGTGNEYPKIESIYGGVGGTVPYDQTIEFDDWYLSTGTP